LVDEIDTETIRSWLEHEIEELEKKLQLYQAMLSLLEECEVESLARARGAREFRSPDGRLVARLYQSRNKLTLTFTHPVPEANPYMKYLVRSLKRIAEENEGIEYSVDRGEDGRIKTITVLGVTRDNADDIIATLEYTAMKIASARRMQER